jgi:hypothetical protein
MNLEQILAKELLLEQARDELRERERDALGLTGARADHSLEAVVPPFDEPDPPQGDVSAFRDVDQVVPFNQTMSDVWD